MSIFLFIVEVVGWLGGILFAVMLAAIVWDSVPVLRWRKRVFK